MRTTVISAQNPGQADDEDSRLPDFAERVRLNQRKLSSDLKPQYEVKVLSGESAPGSLAARHLLVVSRNYGVDNLRIADGSILPRVTTGNTMALRHHRRTGRRDAEGGA